MNVQSLSEYRARHTIDARDSDLQSLPDAEDASRANVPMALTVGCLVGLIFSMASVAWLVVHILRLGA